MFTQTDMILLRVFLTDSDRIHTRPVYEILLNELNRAGARGATVLHGVAGFGQARIIHSAGILSASDSLPLVIEVCEEEARLDALLPILKKTLEEAGTGALITQEKVSAIHFRSAQV